MILERLLLVRYLSALALITISSVLTAQPPTPDPIFRNGFEFPNQPPVANPGQNQSGSVGVPALLDGSASFDPDGDPISFTWQVVERPAGSGADVFDSDQSESLLIPDRAGVYVIELVVFDGELYSAPATATFTATGDLSSSMMIGPAGGAVGLPDGASALIPPGALDSVTPIAIAEIPPPPGGNLPQHAMPVGAVYRLTPAGQSFDKPVQIIVPYDPDLLPVGYDEGAISLFRQGSEPESHMVGSEYSDADPRTDGQVLDAANRRVIVYYDIFSAYRAVAARGSANFVSTTLSVASASVQVLRPPQLRTERPNHHNCKRRVGNQTVDDYSQGPLQTRPTTDVQAIVIHSTNNGNVRRDFEGELGWASSTCNQYFAHYYIDRDGSIYQIADDLTVTNHTLPSATLSISRANSISIELLLNTGEPFDGRQVSSLVRLVDFLMELHAIPRPERNPTTGIVQRNRVDIAAGGDRIVGHADVVNKCDPAGTFMNSGRIQEIRLVRGAGTVCAIPRTLSTGDPTAPALMDILLDSAAVLAREGQHTGIINTQGGDAYELGQAGDGGEISFREDAAIVAAIVGSEERRHWQENDPNLTGQPAGTPVGPGPLIVAPGRTVTLTARGGRGQNDIREYTDVIVAGTLIINGNLGFALTGSFYVSPIGKIIVREGRHGGSLGVFSRGAPLVQGLIDARGENGMDGMSSGGNGGMVSFTFAHSGILLVPTLYTRGGDADLADVLQLGGGPRGGEGGDITIDVESTHVFLGGGIGPATAGAQPLQLPPYWHGPPIDLALMNPPGATNRWSGDYLPPPPPFRRYVVGQYPPPPEADRRCEKSAYRSGSCEGCSRAAEWVVLVSARRMATSTVVPVAMVALSRFSSAVAPC